MEVEKRVSSGVTTSYDVLYTYTPHVWLIYWNAVWKQALIVRAHIVHIWQLKTKYAVHFFLKGFFLYFWVSGPWNSHNSNCNNKYDISNNNDDNNSDNIIKTTVLAVKHAQTPPAYCTYCIHVLYVLHLRTTYQYLILNTVLYSTHCSVESPKKSFSLSKFIFSHLHVWKKIKLWEMETRMMLLCLVLPWFFIMFWQRHIVRIGKVWEYE